MSTILWLADMAVNALALTGYSAEGRVEWAQHQPIEGVPRLQWTGFALATRHLAFCWHPAWTDPVRATDALNAIVGRHQAIRVLWGSGQPMGSGWHVVTSVRWDLEWALGDGTPLLGVHQVELLRWAGAAPGRAPAATAGSPLAVKG